MTSAVMRSERPTVFSPRLRRGLRRLGLRALGSAQLAAGLALALALVTYDTSDPSANVASGGATSNVLGSAGAWIADWLLRGFGAAAAAAAIAPIAWGCRGLKLKRTRRTALQTGRADSRPALPCHGPCRASRRRRMAASRRTREALSERCCTTACGAAVPQFGVDRPYRRSRRRDLARGLGVRLRP